jgi:hypothetical protein
VNSSDLIIRIASSLKSWKGSDTPTGEMPASAGRPSASRERVFGCSVKLRCFSGENFVGAVVLECCSFSRMIGLSLRLGKGTGWETCAIIVLVSPACVVKITRFSDYVCLRDSIDIFAALVKTLEIFICPRTGAINTAW